MKSSRSRFGSLRALAVVALLGVCANVPARAQGWILPPHFETLPIPYDFNLPVGLAFAGDGSMLVIEKTGRVRRVNPQGGVQGPPFLDLSPEVNNLHDRGMLSIVLHPGFVPDGGPNSWVYLAYTASPVFGQDWGYDQNDQYSFARLTRYRAITTASGVVADPASRHVLLGNQLPNGSVPDCIASLADVHTVGSLRFARDGSLIVSTGDGGHADFMDPGGMDNAGFDSFLHPVTGLRGPTPSAQDDGAFRSTSLGSLSGKILRIDPENANGYPSNPFYDGNPASHASRIWALGLRNPYRVELVPGTGASDPALGKPGVILIGDVGWTKYEEIDVSRVGAENFGWPCREGPFAQDQYPAYSPPNPNSITCQTPLIGTLTSPILSWHHISPGAVYPTGVYVDDDGAPLPGFTGSCSIAGPMYAGGEYPPEYLRRMFFADYSSGVIKTIQFNGTYGVVAARDFGSQTGRVVSLERHPITGDIWAVSLTTNQVIRIRYGSNLTPIAVASALPNGGDPPLVVQFQGSDSSDPDQDLLTYDWNFDDQTPHADVANPVHTYSEIGVYQVVLRVTDTFGLSSTTTLQLAVGNSPPYVSIRVPVMGSTYPVPTQLVLFANAVDPEGATLSFLWNVSLYHATHVHPGTFQSTSQLALFDIASSSEDPELVYYKVEVAVTDVGGLTTRDHAFVYPTSHVKDVSGAAVPISALDALSQPVPCCSGNPDIEVIRDQKRPPVGSASVQRQFTTEHDGAQGNDDWLGYEITEPHGPEFRFVGLEFQEGKHFSAGGWFESLTVEVRENGVWSAVENLTIKPRYPVAQARQPFFDGVGYETYDISFDPRAGDAIRLRGDPGGVTGFISCGELRARAIEALVPGALVDLTDRGALLLPGAGFVRPTERSAVGPDQGVVHDGTFPPRGSASVIAEYRTVAVNSTGLTPELWLGYAFHPAIDVSRIAFQEGRDLAGSGALVSLGVQYRAVASGPWMPVVGLAISPAYPSANGVNFERFQLDFATVHAQAIRVIGAPAVAGGDLSVGELRVFGPPPP